MKIWKLILVFVFAAAIIAAGCAKKQDVKPEATPEANAEASNALTWSKGTGAGIIMGSTTNGFTAKSWLSDGAAIDAGLTWNLQAENSSFELYGDFLANSFKAIKLESGQMPLYAGMGAGVGLKTGKFALSVRIPLGLAYLLQTAPVEVFLELVPSVDLLPAADFTAGGGIGARYYFGN